VSSIDLPFFEKHDFMARYYQLEKKVWDEALFNLLDTARVFAPVKFRKILDYKRIEEKDIPDIVYNTPKPVVPLKNFLLPIKENVVLPLKNEGLTIVMGIPACDLAAIDLLDKFYLDEEYLDPFYSTRRKQTILIGSDCHSVNPHCHCTSYGLNPVPGKNQDLTISMVNGQAYISVSSSRGQNLVTRILESFPFRSLEDDEPLELTHIRQKTKKELENMNKRLPNYQESTDAVVNAGPEIWQNYASTCVACGACALICPTCTCFLLIDRPGFEKIRQLDACQYPGFEKTAGGEDPLKKGENRFKNRYMCKYLYRPEKFEAIACTGCGRCIEACIGKISKNELLVELTK
jgi:sulfhydrogenase subunit beta (sulfur reductase)